MIIQIDVDGVLADFMTAYTRLAVQMGLAPEVSGTLDQTAWETYGAVPRENVSRVWDHIKQSMTFWHGAPPLIDKDTFNRLSDLEARHDIYYVTARVGIHAKYQTTKWLEHRGVREPTVVMSSKKGEIAAAIGAHYAIDDKAGNAIFTGYFAKKTHSYIIDRPYNQFDGGVTGSGVRRVATVGAFLDDMEAGK
jgi:uncharacterized HAD superfamily protein